MKRQIWNRFRFSITQQVVDDTKAAIAAKAYPKPSEDITMIED